MNTTIEAICYKYKPLKNNEFPIKIRITKNRKIKYINLGISIVLTNWDFIKNKPKPTCPNRDYIEKVIANKISELKSTVLELKSEKREFTATSLVNKIVNPIKVLTVKELFDEHIAYLKENKRFGYALSVEQVYKSILKFNNHLDIYFSEIDIAWLKKYETWLRNNNMSENTIGIRFRTLRMVYNLAIEKEIVKTEYYPFKKYKVSKLHQETAKRSLTKKQILTIINYDVEGKSSYTHLAINVFTFSYLMGGINFADIAYLTKENLIDNRLVYTRRKTAKLIKLPIQEKALSIINQYDNSDNKYLFPILSSFHKTDQQKRDRIHKVITKINEVLKSIGKELCLPIKITTYVSRHSFATVLKRSGASTSIICESLGHSSEKVTQYYLDSFENSQIDKAMENLL